MTTFINNISLFISLDLLTYCLSSIWIISFSLVFCYFFHKKLKDTIVLGFIASFVLLFLGGIINNISVFYTVGWIIIIVFYIFIIIKKKFDTIKQALELDVVLTYLILSLFIYIYYQQAGFRFTDEFMHWGPMVKEMFRTNAFYCSKESMLLVHKDYPPFFSLIELLFCFFGREYVEKYLYIGLVSFVLAIVLSLSFNNKNKILSIVSLLLIGFIFQYIPDIQDNTSIYNSIYIDYVLALLFVYVINYLISNDQYDNYSYKFLALSFTSLLLSKQIGIFYFIICILYILIFVKNKNKKIVISIILPFIFFVIWKTIVKVNEINGQFSLENVSLRPEALTILKTYLNAVIDKSLFIKPFNINLLTIFIIIIVAMYFVDKTLNKKMTIVYIVSFVFYYFVIGLLYIFVFSVEEALILSSFERYLISYVYVGIALISLYICNLNRVLYFVLYFVLTVLLCDFSNSNINNILDKKRILVINQQGANVEFNFNQTTGAIYNFDICDYLYENDVEKFKGIISKYDYVYVYLYDDYFYRIWVNLTSDKSLENDSLFYKENDNPLVLRNSNFNTIYYVIKYSETEIQK